jgi:hypothetical protein
VYLQSQTPREAPRAHPWLSQRGLDALASMPATDP